MPDDSLQLYPLWPTLRSDMLLSLVYPQALIPHYISVGQLSDFLGEGLSLDSPAFVGTPTAPTPPSGDDSTRLATTEYVQTELSALDLGGDFPEAPLDGQSYGRTLADWQPVLRLSGGTISGSLTVTGQSTFAAVFATAPVLDDNSSRVVTSAWVRAQRFGATVGDTFPASPAQGQLHWLSTDGQLYIRYGTTWVIANTAPSALPPGTSANDNLIYDGSVWGAQRPRYGVAFSYVGGLLGASQLLGIHCFTKAVTFNANFSGWLGHTPEAGGTASATASTVITVERALVASPNSWSGVGSITIAAGSINPSFATTGGAAVNFSVGDRMRLVGPSTPDPTFQNFYCSLVGKEA